MNIFNNRPLFNVLRYFAKKKITGNLGKIIEDDERITCYINKSNCNKEKYKYIISCFGITLKDKKLARKYNIDKPICYVIDNIDFNNHKVYIFGYDNCEVVVKNSKFNYGLYIVTNGKCSIENLSIKTSHSFSISAKQLIIKGINIINNLSSANINLQVMLESSSKINVINTNIGRENDKTSVFLSSKDDLNMINSSITADNIECETSKIIADSTSLLTGSKEVKLKTMTVPRLKITSPSIIYNYNVLSNQNKKELLDNSITFKRLELIETLKRISNKCKMINNQKIDEYSSNLSNNSIAKTLRK